MLRVLPADPGFHRKGVWPRVQPGHSGHCSQLSPAMRSRQPRVRVLSWATRELHGSASFSPWKWSDAVTVELVSTAAAGTKAPGQSLAQQASDSTHH